MSDPGTKQIFDFNATPTVYDSDLLYSGNVVRALEQATTVGQVRRYIETDIAANLTAAGAMDGTESIPVGRTTLFSTTLTKVAQWIVNTFAGVNDATGAAVSIATFLSSSITIPVPTYTALRAYTGAATSARVTGYTSSGTAPLPIAGNFVVMPSDTTSADNGGTIIVDSTGRRWYRVYDDIVNILWFQPAGDGVTDDTAILTTAMTYASVNNKTLHWPEAYSYGVTNVNVHGKGYYFNWTGTPRLIQLSTRVASTYMLLIGGGQSMTTTATTGAVVSSCTLTVASVTNLSVGDIVRIQTNRLAYGDHRFSLGNALSQLSRVESISGLTVTFSDPFIFDYPVGLITTGTAQGGTSGTITLAANDASTVNQILCYAITIVSGTGAGQTRYVNSYNATTKVVDIGTTWTSYPAAPWVTIPDNTSVYQITATVSLTAMTPGLIRSVGGLRMTGYATSGVDVYGMAVYATDSAQLADMDLEWFSWGCLMTQYNYRPMVRNNRFAHANHAPNSSGGIGYGHVSQGDFACSVIGNTAENCSSGFEAQGGTAYLLRIGNICTGGSVDYTGAPMWPAPTAAQQTCGLGCHTGTFGVTDIGNELCDVYYGAKYRSFWATCQNNNFRGAIYEAVGVFYVDRVTITGNTFDDGITYQPNTGTNNNENGDDLPAYGTRPTANMLRAFVVINQANLNLGASVTVKGNIVKSASFAPVMITGETATGDLALTVTDNDFSIVAESVFAASAVRTNNPPATIGLREFTAMNNVLRLGGAGWGTIKVDNINKYYLLDYIDSSKLPFVAQLGEREFLAMMAANTGVTIPLGVLGQNQFVLTIYEKDGLVTNCFSGLVKRGATTAVQSLYNSGVTFSTGTPNGTSGTAGNLNIYLRTDVLYINNQTTTTGNFVVQIDGGGRM